MIYWVVVTGSLGLAFFSGQALAACKLDAIGADTLHCVTEKSECAYSPDICDIPGHAVKYLVTNKYFYSRLSTDVWMSLDCQELTKLTTLTKGLNFCDHLWHNGHTGDSRYSFLPGGLCTTLCPHYLRILIPLVEEAKEAKKPPASGAPVTIQEVSCLEVHEEANVRMDYELLVKGGASTASFNFSMNCQGYSKMSNDQLVPANMVKRVPFPSVVGATKPENCTASAWTSGKAVATKTASCTVGFF